mmetsp:Transcript_6123/g.9240  ORF Transcript_6123/g.9240 Transcript_6123/m.9240 type:complete len:182 (-) Transcript_6123:39-584(-)
MRFVLIVVQVLYLLSSAVTADLLTAISTNKRSSIKAALENIDKDEINKRGAGGQTPLMHAVLSGKTTAVELLLEAGADFTIPEKDGYTPMHGAGFQGRADIAEILIDYGLPVSDMHADGYTPLHRACWGSEKRHADTVLVFLEAGVDKDEPSRDGKTCSEMTSNKRTKKILQKWKARLQDL